MLPIHWMVGLALCCFLSSTLFVSTQVHGRALCTMPASLSETLLWSLHARAACAPLPVHHAWPAPTWWRPLVHICHLPSPMPYRYVGMTRPQHFLIVVESDQELASPQMAIFKALAKMRHLETG